LIYYVKIIDNEDENKFIYSDIHIEFREHIEALLSSNLGFSSNSNSNSSPRKYSINSSHSHKARSGSSMNINNNASGTNSNGTMLSKDLHSSISPVKSYEHMV
jgi:hypothetical protein